MRYYAELTKREAAAALEEFLAEREPALELLRNRLRADGQDPDALLDDSPDSLVPLWQWVVARLTALTAQGATNPAMVPREEWPSWARYSVEVEPVLSLESLRLLDGLVSYLARVVQQHTHAGRWQPGQHASKRYRFRHHPVLAEGEHQVFFPASVSAKARKVVQGGVVPDDALASHAHAVIAAYNEVAPVPAPSPAPRVEVTDVRGESGGYDLEVGLSDEVAHERSDLVDQLAGALAKEDGVAQVVREDREVLLVRAPSWDVSRLQRWMTIRLEEHLVD
jgi:hypothetical protein